MALQYHPKRGTIVCVDFDRGFKAPEMVKRRLCVIVSPPIKSRGHLCTVVPLSTTAPNPVEAYHYRLTIPFQLPPRWGAVERWVKADMVCAVGFHRVDLLSLGKDRSGQRRYQKNTLSKMHLAQIEDAMAVGLGLPPLTR